MWSARREVGKAIFHAHVPHATWRGAGENAGEEGAGAGAGAEVGAGGMVLAMPLPLADINNIETPGLSSSSFRLRGIPYPISNIPHPTDWRTLSPSKWMGMRQIWKQVGSGRIRQLGLGDKHISTGSVSQWWCPFRYLLFMPSELAHTHTQYLLQLPTLGHEFCNRQERKIVQHIEHRIPSIQRRLFSLLNKNYSLIYSPT